MNEKVEKHNLSIGFIGGGRITRIILAGWKRKGDFPGAIMVSDTNPDVLQKLKQTFSNIETCSDNAKAAGCDIVFLSLHPPAISAIFGDIKAALQPSVIFVSLRQSGQWLIYRRLWVDFPG